ncbi:MAG: hypothetical protein AAF945_08060 [Actinomycetota bacterium]
MGMRGRRWIAACVVMALAAACSSGDDEDSGDVDASGGDEVAATDPPASDMSSDAAPAATDAPAETDSPSSTDPTPDTEPDASPGVDVAPSDLVAAIEADLAAGPAGCDPLDPARCVLPFPSDATATSDDSTPTGLRIAFPDGGLPSNSSGVPIDVSDWNRLDGFTPNASIVTFVEGLDPDASSLPPWTDLAASLAVDATVVMIDMATGARIPLWAELDAKADADADRLLVIHPAVVLEHATTYAVALRGLVDRDGRAIEPSATFRTYRDALATEVASVEDRRDDMEVMFDRLAESGVDRSELQLAWTFTTASTDGITGDLLAMRDLALDAIGDEPPGFEIRVVDEDHENPLMGRFIEGRMTVPNLMTDDGGPGTRINRGDDGDPAINADAPTRDVDIACTISATTLEGDGAVPVVSYGHGLLGSHLEVDAGNIVSMASEHDVVYCATKWAGFSDEDIPTAVASLSDLSGFGIFTDRMHQGVVNHVLLGRLMLAPGGLAADPAFIRPDGSPMLDTERLVYDGNSQGGIMGSMLAAVSPDIERAVLGVPGINYSMLLPRSIDFDVYEAIFEPAYPNDLDRALLLSVIQMLWDRSEGGGYVRHLVDDPLPGSSPTPVLLHVAQGDQQVTELSAFVAARTMGIPIHRPVLADVRSDEVEPGWALDAIEYPSEGSGIVVWDSGAALIPFVQLPPRQGDDPHSRPRSDEQARVQKAAFLFDDTLVDVCTGPCTTATRVDGG